MRASVEVAGLTVSGGLFEFLETEVLPAANVPSETFWTGLAQAVADFAPRNADLLRVRDGLQGQLDAWHRLHPGPIRDTRAYRAFLEQIGYLQPPPGPFQISTTGVDPEITEQAGPQLVVPITNARFAINAANARWGSLYDAVYGSDLLDSTLPPDMDASARAAAVVAFGRDFLNSIAPLEAASHSDAVAYQINSGSLQVLLADGSVAGLVDPGVFAGFRGETDEPNAILFRHHGLHVDLRFDRNTPVGAADATGMSDIILESAVTTIMDLEDSVSVVDAEDKVQAYSVWGGLLDGGITDTFEKNGKPFVRSLNPDRFYTRPDGSGLTLPGRSLMFVRHVGMHMYTDAVLDRDGREIPEGFLDAFVTAAIALPSLRRETALANSRTGSLYIVKPKQHGPAEVAFTVELFARVEQVLGLAPGTLKVGIMDEERRTSVNLSAAIEAARERVVFINTGFLDRTGDEIHTSMLAAPMVRKADMKAQRYIAAYESANVEAGLAAGFAGHAQIGKGMWAMPDLMADMYRTKSAHPAAGATTAWVPSPTAATIHALHYHQIDVRGVQAGLSGHREERLDEMLVPPLATRTPSDREVQEELDDNVQSILGYVVRWVDEGIGCSKVPDLHDVALMEDRATLRISSQLLANWLRHGVLTREAVDDALRRIAPVVDRQNADDPAYEPLHGPDGSESIALQAARDLIVFGDQQPNGYTEFILHKARRSKKGAGVTVGAAG